MNYPSSLHPFLWQSGDTEKETEWLESGTTVQGNNWLLFSDVLPFSDFLSVLYNMQNYNRFLCLLFNIVHTSLINSVNGW